MPPGPSPVQGPFRQLSYIKFKLVFFSLAVGRRVSTTLTILNLRGNEVSDRGAASLAEAISGRRTLTNLNLSLVQRYF